MKFAVGFLLGWLTSVPVYLHFAEPKVPDEVLYEAYRQCIPMSDCKMTPQDWLGYYEIKWRLEEKNIE